MAPDRAAHRRRVQTGAVPRGTGAHRQPVPGVAPTRPGETLTAENSALRDTLENMSTISNTVYYVVGTKDELEQKGIITEEGGARFLFVLWKSGKTLVPSRNLDPGVFTVADRRHFTEVPLPHADKEYRTVAPQDTCALETHAA